VHPGYGFLSENAGFARAVVEAGLTWIGPPPEAVEVMGSKIEAKKRMAAAGVPVLEDLDPADVTAELLPVLVKASAGGGGRGMRVVRELDALEREIAAARREAGSAFGDDAVFCERYLERGRHVEVQVMADAHGTVWAVGERECSIQRRHQKVLEEAPSPLVERTPGMRERLFEAARAAAGAIGYTGAGTVEFLATDAGDFYFLEMNTRLQVEHPVTEATTGLDLVALQLDVAAGRPLPAGGPPPTRGWSVEARLYAEDPAHDWQPASGTLWALDVPGVTSRFEGPACPGLRLDSGVDPGGSPAEPRGHGAPSHGHGAVVGVHYDAMLAKLVSLAPTREEACTMLSGALARARIHGLVTNRPLLVRMLRHEAFLAGELTTAFLDEHGLAELAAPLADAEAVRVSALAAALATECADHRSGPVGRMPAGFRNVGASRVTRSFTLGDEEIVVGYTHTRHGVRPDGGLGDLVEVLEVGEGACVLEVRGVRRRLEVVRRGCAEDGWHVDVDSPLGPVALDEPPRHPDPAATVASGSLLAPMPGAVVRVAVACGDTVTAGQTLLVVEAMKMEHVIAADTDGVVTELPVAVGSQVGAGDVLAVLASPEESAPDDHPAPTTGDPS